jgi:transcriptional regulator with XRE-family HTH domain
MKREHFLKKVAIAVKNGRTKKRLTLFDLEVMTDISKRQLIRIEQGKANLAAYTLCKLINALEIEVKELFDFDLPHPKK